MHRVELKDIQSKLIFYFIGYVFLMHRVELKVEMRIDELLEHLLFLMHRVELKDCLQSCLTNP